MTFVSVALNVQIVVQHSSVPMLRTGYNRIQDLVPTHGLGFTAHQIGFSQDSAQQVRSRGTSLSIVHTMVHTLFFRLVWTKYNHEMRLDNVMQLRILTFTLVRIQMKKKFRRKLTLGQVIPYNFFVA